MSEMETSKLNYKKIEIDNSVCKRRFHIAYEEGRSPVAETSALCPHCGITLFEAKNHPPVILSRDENLIQSPDGSRTTLNTCKFLK